MIRTITCLMLTVASSLACADLRDLVAEPVLEQIAAETSGEEARRNLDFITLQHRMRSGRQFDAATDHILGQLRHYGLATVDTVEFAADGKTMYGTQKSRPLWEVKAAELWELGEKDGEPVRRRRLGDWDALPLTLAQDSLAGDVTASLVDIGAGTTEADYANRDIRGKLVLTSSQPGAVADLAVGQFGAAGIISYAANQRSAWWQQDDRLIRWGHLDSFPATPTFAFMVSLGEARKLQQRLAAGEAIRFHAKVEAEHRVGRYRFAVAAIPGADPRLREQEILFTCHLDHPRPGANDNASGCVSILETARTLQALIDNGRLPRPARTIRFLWPAEIEGSIMYLSQHEDPSRIKANIHMDMVGGAPVTKAVFRISGGPISVPTFISDVGFEVGAFVNAETKAYADGAATKFPLAAPEGGKEPLMALTEGLDMGSDHDVFREGSFRIPGLYLHDWPDRYIHTNMDLAANIDPTKLKRAAFIGVTTAVILANLTGDDAEPLLAMLQRNALARSATLSERLRALAAEDAVAVTGIHFAVERTRVDSLGTFIGVDAESRARSLQFLDRLQALLTPLPGDTTGAARDDTVFVRNAAVKGPMHAFGYSYIVDRMGEDAYRKLRLPAYTAGGDQYAYEALNFVDGQRSVSDIRAWLTTELGPVPLTVVREYLDALRAIDVIRER